MAQKYTLLFASKAYLLHWDAGAITYRGRWEDGGEDPPPLMVFTDWQSAQGALDWNGSGWARPQTLARGASRGCCESQISADRTYPFVVECCIW
jgi:hypothetical protein